MDIFENLENLNISEACFEDIMSIVEDVLNEKYENGYEDAPKGHRHKVGDEVQVHFGAGLDGGKSGKISSLYKNHNGHTWAKGEGADGAFDVPASYLRTKKKVVTEEYLESMIRIVEDLVSTAYDKWDTARKKLHEPELEAIGKRAEKNNTPEENAKYQKAYDEYHHAHQLLNKAFNLRDKSEAESRGHNRAGKTKGERGQRSADFRNPRYSGENGMYIKDRRAEQDAQSGYNIAINKAIRRKKGTN